MIQSIKLSIIAAMFVSASYVLAQTPREELAAAEKRVQELKTLEQQKMQEIQDNNKKAQALSLQSPILQGKMIEVRAKLQPEIEKISAGVAEKLAPLAQQMESGSLTPEQFHQGAEYAEIRAEMALCTKKIEDFLAQNPELIALKEAENNLEAQKESLKAQNKALLAEFTTINSEHLKETLAALSLKTQVELDEHFALLKNLAKSGLALFTSAIVVGALASYYGF